MDRTYFLHLLQTSLLPSSTTDSGRQVQDLSALRWIKLICGSVNGFGAEKSVIRESQTPLFSGLDTSSDIDLNCIINISKKYQEHHYIDSGII
jgi:hypothetical protein